MRLHLDQYLPLTLFLQLIYLNALIKKNYIYLSMEIVVWKARCLIESFLVSDLLKKVKIRQPVTISSMSKCMASPSDPILTVSDTMPVGDTPGAR